MNVMTRLGLLLAASIFAAAGCAGHDDGTSEAAPTKPEAEPPVEELPPEPPAVPASEKITVAVASVMLQDDCPDAGPAAARPSVAPARRRTQVQDSRGVTAPSVVRQKRGNLVAASCTQSMIHLSIDSDAEDALPFSVRAVRLKQSGKEDILAELTARNPEIFDEQYRPWDATIAAGASHKVFYRLGATDWGQVEAKLRRGGFFVVEIDVDIDGEVRTLVSSPVPRDEPHNIVT